MQQVTILAGGSQSLISDSGDSEFYHQRQRKDAISAEIKACLDLYFGGQGKEEKQIRLAVSELIFAVKSKEAADQLPLEQLERGLRILHAYEKVPQHNLENKDSMLSRSPRSSGSTTRGSRKSGKCRFERERHELFGGISTEFGHLVASIAGVEQRTSHHVMQARLAKPIRAVVVQQL